MRHICGWCRCETAPPDGDRDELETTGICEGCLATAGAELNKHIEAIKLRRADGKRTEL